MSEDVVGYLTLLAVWVSGGCAGAAVGMWKASRASWPTPGRDDLLPSVEELLRRRGGNRRRDRELL
jgi:hypothetical protein